MSTEFRPEKLAKESWKEHEVTESFLESVTKSGKLVVGRATRCEDNMTLHAKLGTNCEIIIPKERVDYRFAERFNEINVISLVGEKIYFVINSYRKEGGKFICEGDRAEAQQVCIRDYVDKLSIGDVIDVYVKGITDYCLFCDIGCGVVSLLHINDFCVSKIVKPKQELAGLGELKAVVKRRDEQGRIYLTHKELLGTWEQAIEMFKPRDSVIGTVVNINEYGVFVAIGLNVVGLAQIDSSCDLTVGDTVLVLIKSIDTNKMRVKLHIISKKEEAKNNTNFKYFYDGEHINYWRYDNGHSNRVVETWFESRVSEKDDVVGASDSTGVSGAVEA